MYQLNKQDKRKKRRRIAAVLIVILLLLALGWTGWFIKFGMRPETTISQSKRVVTKITFNNGTTKHFSEPGFALDLPSDWEAFSHDTNPYNVYRWHGTGGASRTRLLDIYVDSIPVNFALNRVVAIESSGDHIALRGSVSDNCSTFTKPADTSGQYGTRAKWQDVEFNCDQVNKDRNIVGAISKDGINMILLGSPNTEYHKYFFVYTENSYTPDYTAFYTALQSFTLQ